MSYGFEWMPAVVLVGALVLLMVPAFALIGLAVLALAAVAALVALAGAILATQPFAVQEPGAGEVDHATAALEPLDRLAVEGLRIGSVAQQRA